jgi:hypothetical protein
MPPLKTRSIRFTENQLNELSLKYKGDSSFLVRRLLDIFITASMPGAEIIKLRKEIQDMKGEKNVA